MNFKKTGYNLGVITTIVVLIWIGIFKFTATEAMGIKHDVSNSFLMSWMYNVTSDQTVSDLIGAFEIITALLLLGSFWNNKIGRIAGYAGIIIFLTTISFLFTTPGIWKAVEGVPTTDFFVVKDLAFLAIMFLVVGEHSTNEIHKQI